MKNIFVLAAILALSIPVHAQKKGTSDPNLPAFGVVGKTDLEMKECDFDKNAEAIILVDDGLLEFISDGMEMKRRMRIKILNDKGLEWANVHLSYASGNAGQHITGIEAQTYNLDEKGNVVVTKLDKKLVYDKKLNKKYAEKVFTFPEVKIGSIIEYQYRHIGVGLVDWYFQRNIPVLYSHFVLDFPEEIEVATLPYCSREYEKTVSNKTRRVITKYTMSKVPAFRDEPFTINSDFYRDRLETKVMAYPINGIRSNRIATWPQVIKFLMEDEDFGVQVKRTIPRTTELNEKLKNITASYEKMKTIYKYVQDNMEWNEYNGIWALDGVRSAWKDKKGTVGEINLILVNLLKDAGLSARPVLVSTHENGVVNTVDAGTYDYPGFHQFNKVMAYVDVDNQIYVLDATQKNNPAHLIPSDIIATQGLVIEKIETSEWGWKTLWKDDLSSKNTFLINGVIDNKGKMEGNISISSFDYARIGRINSARKGKDKFIEKYCSASSNGLKVDEVSFENMDSDSLPLIQNIKFNQQLNEAGDYKYFSLNILTGLEKNPFVADSRSSDVFFGTKQMYTIVGNFTLPEDYEFDELPRNLKMILPDTSIVITRMAQVNGHMLQSRVTLEFKNPWYPVAQYENFQEFYLRLQEILNEQFVIRKKKKA